MAHVSEARPDSGLGFQVFSGLDSGAHRAGLKGVEAWGTLSVGRAGFRMGATWVLCCGVRLLKTPSPRTLQ